MGTLDIHLDAQNASSVTYSSGNIVDTVNAGVTTFSASTTTIIHNGSGHNNNPVFEFTSEEGKNLGAIIPDTPTHEFVVFVVAEPTNATSGSNDLVLGDWGFHKYHRNGTNTVMEDGDGGSIVAPYPTNNDRFIHALQYNGANSALWHGTTKVATGALSTTKTSGTELRLGSGYWFGGFIGEVKRFVGTMTDAEILTEMQSLEQKWEDSSAATVFSPPSGHDYIELATTFVPTDSVVYGDTFVVGDQLAYQTIATHTNGSTGTVVLDQFGVPTITGTSDAGTWTFDYWIKDANGDNTPVYAYSLVVA
jgi:hypothetical protein